MTFRLQWVSVLTNFFLTVENYQTERGVASEMSLFAHLVLPIFGVQALRSGEGGS
jgi:hypothetical protein